MSDDERMPVVAVNWEKDARLEAEYTSKDDLDALTPMRFVSVGILLRDDEQAVAIAQDHSIDRGGEDDDAYRGVLVIPRASVLSIQTLGYARWAVLATADDEECCA